MDLAAGPMAGMVSLYIIVEILKWFIGKDSGCIGEINPLLAAKINDLHQWHDHYDEDGRRSWYVPRTFFRDQAKMVEMLRDISHNQENTARLLSDLIKKMET